MPELKYEIYNILREGLIEISIKNLQSIKKFLYLPFSSLECLLNNYSAYISHKYILGHSLMVIRDRFGNSTQYIEFDAAYDLICSHTNYKRTDLLKMWTELRIDYYKHDTDRQLIDDNILQVLDGYLQKTKEVQEKSESESVARFARVLGMSYR